MKTRRKLLPGQPGTKQLLKQYGDRLVCVRYRYDRVGQRKLKTVELIIDDAEWHPDPSRIPPHKRVALRVGYGERAIIKAVKAAGGRWNRPQRVWELAYKDVVALGLTDRIVGRDEQHTT
jgi:hypothetical protein